MRHKEQKEGKRLARFSSSSFQEKAEKCFFRLRPRSKRRALKAKMSESTILPTSGMKEGGRVFSFLLITRLLLSPEEEKKHSYPFTEG